MIIWKYKKAIIIGVVIIVLIVAASQLEYKFRDGAAAAIVPQKQTGGSVQKEVSLPSDSSFRLAAETEVLRLKLDDSTGHFIVEDKRNENVWRSYPEPQDWQNETIGGAWKYHLASPLMFQYIDFTKFNSPPKDSNFTVLNGTVEDITEIDGGVQWTYAMPELGFSIPVQIRIEDDYVETTIIDDGIEEEGLSLIWVRLFPFLAAEHSTDREGYMFIPDGSGALIHFDDNRINANRGYQEAIFGTDSSFQNSFGYRTRYPARMPVFGIKSGEKAMLAVMEDGAEHSELIAAPSGMLSQYNWIAAQQTYRSTFEQVTNRNKGTGYTTYNKEERFGTDRSVRYYLLDKGQSDYVGMASRYRQYLIEEKGLQKLANVEENIPLHLTLLGGDTADGMMGNRYIKATTTEEAGRIVMDLHKNGIEHMSVTYLGWQKDGYNSLGGYLPTDSRLGGNGGLKSFVELAHSIDVPVLLGVNYDLNNTGSNGFKAQYHAIRDMAGTMQEARVRGNNLYLASKTFILNSILKDLPLYEDIGIDGLFLIRTGSRLESDYNTKQGSTRTEGMLLQQEIMHKVKERLGKVETEFSNFYILGNATHINELPNDYSYDLFSDQTIPFAQIALHGLITYTSSYENDRQQYTHDFLRDIELGALPSFLFTAIESAALTEAHGMQLKSSHYADWADIAATEYERYNEALSGVQNQFIVDHRELTDGVRATTYEDGTTIVVNYTDQPYIYNNVEVAAMNYAVLEGAEGR